MQTTEYDLIVLGAGAVGENIADRAVQGGLTALLIEHELVGGECSYWACMPSKALLRSANVLRAAQHVPGAAEAVTGKLDIGAVLARRDSFTSNWSDAGQVKWAHSAGIDVLRGHGRITGTRKITVPRPTAKRCTSPRGTPSPSRPVQTRSSPISTGSAHPSRGPAATRQAHEASRQASPSSAAASSQPRWQPPTPASAPTSRSSSRSGLLEGTEPFAQELVLQSLQGQGVRVLLNTTTTRVSRDDGYHVETSTGQTIHAERLLVAAGRTPRTNDIGLETIGLEPGAWIPTDDTLRVDGFDWLYAVGDVTNRALLTHQGKYQARAAGDVIAARANNTTVSDAPWGTHVATADHEAVPQVTFTYPEVASVGLTAAAAKAAGYNIRAVDYEIGHVAGASVHADDYTGTARMVVDEDRKVIIGVTFVGPDVSELLHAATTAIVGEIPIDRLWHAVPAYPTVNEIWLRLLETYGRPIPVSHAPSQAELAPAA